MSEKNKSSEPQGFHIADIWLFLRSKLMLHTLIRLFLVVVILWILQSFFLSFYTNHGQKLKLPNYTGVLLDNANKHAGPRGYEIVISDSLFMKGRPGGIILSQVPRPGSMVKRGRMIYVTVSKYAAETLLSDQLPVLYGKKYEHKKVELFNTFELYTRITGVQFDPGPEGHILQVSYKGKLLINDQERTAGIPIARGDTLEVVISTKKGGAVPIPDLICKTLAEARFLLESSKLELGAIREEGEITDAATAYVIGQFPLAQTEETVDLGTAFKITIAQERPANCDPQ